MNQVETSTEQAGPRSDSNAPTRTRLGGFWALFVTQFQNAFSDNVLKFLTTFIIIALGFSQERRDQLVPLVGLVFALWVLLYRASNAIDQFWTQRIDECMIGAQTTIFQIDQSMLL